MKSFSMLLPVLAFAQGTQFPAVKIEIDPEYSMTVNGVEHPGAFTELHRDELVGIYRTESFLFTVDHTGMLSILAQLPKKNGEAGALTLYQAKDGERLKSVYANGVLKERYRAYIVDLQYPDQTILRQEFLFETSLNSPTNVFVIRPKWLSQASERSLKFYSLDLDFTWGKSGYKALTLEHVYQSVSAAQSIVIAQPQSQANSYKYSHLSLRDQRTPLVSYASAREEASNEYEKNQKLLLEDLKRDWVYSDQEIHLQWDEIDLPLDDAQTRLTDFNFIDYVAYLKVRDKITDGQVKSLMQALALTAQTKEVIGKDEKATIAVMLSQWTDKRRSRLGSRIKTAFKPGLCSTVSEHSKWITEARNL